MKNKGHIIQMRRRRVSELYLQGKNQFQIAEIITAEFRKENEKPFSQSHVSYDLKRVREEWRSARVNNYDAKVDMELARLDEIEREAWAAWHRTIGIYKTETRKNTLVKGTDGNQGLDLPAEEITVKKEKLAGDPRFLAAVQDCVKKRCEILGLNAPVKAEMAITGDVLMAAINQGSKRVEAVNGIAAGA
jgi:hypothetical protein